MGAGADSVQIGTSADAAASTSIAIGKSAKVPVGAGGSIAIGDSAEIALGGGGGDNVAVGPGAKALWWRTVAFGMGAIANAVSSTALGRRAYVAVVHGIAIGRGSRLVRNAGTALGFGSSGSLYLGSGESHRYTDQDGAEYDVLPSTEPISIHPMEAFDEIDGTHTSIAGGDLILCGGRSTGTAAGGAVAVSTSPAGGVDNNTQNALVERVKVFSNGDVEILSAGALIMRSANGTRFRVAVGDDGSLSTQAIV